MKNKQYTDLLDDFYYTAYQLSSSTLYSPIDDKEGRKAIKHCSILLVIGIIVNFISLWIAPIDFDKYHILPYLQISVLLVIGLAMGYVVRENWERQRGFISAHLEIQRLELRFKTLQKQLCNLLASEDAEEKPWNNTIEYFRNLYRNEYSSITYGRIEHLSSDMPSDSIPNGFTQDSWILCMMKNAERKRDLEQKAKKEQEYLRKEKKRDLFHQVLRITKYVLTGIITISVFLIFTYLRMGFLVTLINTILIPTMIYVIILDRFLW